MLPWQAPLLVSDSSYTRESVHLTFQPSLYVLVPCDKTGLLLPIFSWDVHSKTVDFRMEG